MSDSEFDFLIAGGGTAGCVLASRLSHAGHSVALFEAGAQEYSEQVMSPMGAAALHETPLEYKYKSTAQKHLGNLEQVNYGGRLLGGSSAVNYGNWTRCHAKDYDAWAETVGHERWGYKRMLKYLKKVEKHHDENADGDVHGFEGPMHTTRGARHYPLRDPLKAALIESGFEYNDDANGGSPFGFSLISENWRDGKRQPASLAYDLSKVTIFTKVTVKRVVIDGILKEASGLELVDGRTFRASKEVIICCGPIRTPQLLMLSGIGPAEHLSSLPIPLVADLPVGANFHDHLAVILYWKLKHPDQGLTIGSQGFMQPGFEKGNPIDWIVTGTIPDPSKAATIDKLGPDDLLIREPRGHFEIFVAYAPLAAFAFFDHSLVGTHISTPVLGLLPTSRGTVTLASTDPAADPIIDPNYLDSEMDREAIRAGVRQVCKMMLDTPTGQSIIEEDTPPPGCNKLTTSSNAEEIDKRVAAAARSFYQGAGTAAMGSVVDTKLRVKGIRRLRIVDASVLTLPLAGHYQYPIYAIAEAAADLILGLA